MTDLLKGKVAIVTGAGRGIGQAEALALAAEGARVVVNDYGSERAGGGGDGSPADETVEEIKRRGGEAVANYESVADYQAAGRIVQTALDAYGQLDVLVNNAGIFRDVLFHEMTEDDWDSIVSVHLKGTFNTCHHVVPLMMKQRSGAIINTASSQWRNPEGRSSYAAAKGGIVSLTYDLAWEMRPYNVTVNAIAPMALTRSSENTGEYAAYVAASGLTRNKPADEANRPAPEFVPPMVVYLATGLSPDVTGCVFRVGAGKVGLYSHPSETRSIYRDHLTQGPWPVDELCKLLPSTILQGNPKAPHIS